MATIGNTINQRILDEKDWFFGFVGEKRVKDVVEDPLNQHIIKTLRMRKGIDLYNRACYFLENMEDKKLSDAQKENVINKAILLFYAIDPVQRVTEKFQTEYYGKEVNNVAIYALSEEPEELLEK